MLKRSARMVVLIGSSGLIGTKVVAEHRNEHLFGTFDLLRVTCGRFSQCLVDRLVESHEILDVFDAQLTEASYPKPYDARPQSAEFGDHLRNIETAVCAIAAV